MKSRIPVVEEMKALIRESVLQIKSISFIHHSSIHSINIYWAIASSTPGLWKFFIIWLWSYRNNIMIQCCKLQNFVFSHCLNIPTNRLWAPHPDNQVHPCDKSGSCHKFLFLLFPACDKNSRKLNNKIPSHVLLVYSTLIFSKGTYPLVLTLPWLFPWSLEPVPLELLPSGTLYGVLCQYLRLVSIINLKFHMPPQM